MDLISTFINKNLDDFIKSYASAIFPQTDTNSNPNSSESDDENDTNEQSKEPKISIEYKEYSQPDSPNIISSNENILTHNSFIDKSIVESITSETNKTLLNEINESQISENENENEITNNKNNKMYGEYGKENFNLSIDILPIASNNKNEIKWHKIEIESNIKCNDKIDTEIDEQWTQLPNVVNTNKIKYESQSVLANDSFLTNIAKEIELLDEELSLMGIINKENKNEIVINDKLNCLKWNKNKEKCNENKNSVIIFSNENEKDAFFDPLISPIKCNQKNNKYNEPIFHSNATKIQKQWKKFQLKTLLINTFNRHLKQAKNNNLPLTINDLMASTTHEIVDSAEKLFTFVHENNNNNENRNRNINPKIGNYNYSQLHFYGSPALDWSSIYSMIESIVLRNLLYFENCQIVKKIFDTQNILNDIILSNNNNSNADNILIEQLTNQLIQFKTQLYQSCNKNIPHNYINPLQLFPPNVNIFRPNYIKPKPIQNQPMSPNKSVSTKPELNQIRNQLSLLRKSFSRRRSHRNVSKIGESMSPKLTSNLCSDIMKVNNEIDSLCNNTPIVKIEYNNDNRPMTAPHLHNNNNNNNNGYELPAKKPYLKRKKLPKLCHPIAKKVDWSYVKPKTISRLSNNVQSIRNTNNRRTYYKPNTINWKKRVSSRVDCNWSPNKYKSSMKIKKSNLKHKQKQKQSKEFINSYSNNNFNNNKINTMNDDKYLFYLKKGNKIGKISRDSAKAQLHDGSGSMILQTKQKIECDNNNNNNNCDMEIAVSDNDTFESENQLKELQQTFAAIEKAMKQRKQQ